MNRDVKFRGYAVDEMVENQWMFGTGLHKTVFTDEYAAETGVKEEWFVFTEYGWVHVEPKSIGQYTGLKDKNGVEIYEGDILEFEDEDFKWIVIYNFGSCIAVGGKHNQSEELIEFYDWSKDRLDVVVVGNIYEHPHLLEVAQ